MRTKLARVVPTCLLLFVAARDLSSQGPSCGVLRASDGTRDYLHPKAFVNVLELYGEEDTSEPLYTAELTQNAYARSRRAFIEVDRNSTLSITFARQEILAIPDFRANLQISATLKGQPVEVPGYAVVGQDRPQNTVEIRSGGEVLRWTCAADLSIAEVNALTDAVESYGRGLAAYRDEADGLVRQRTSIDAELVQKRTELTTLRSQRELDPNRASELDPIITTRESEIQRLVDQRTSLNNPAIPIYAGTTAQLAELARFTSLLEFLASDAGVPIRRQLVQTTSFTNDVIVRNARTIVDTRLDTLARTLPDGEQVDQAAVDRRLRAASEFRNSLSVVRGVLSEYQRRVSTLPQINDPLMLQSLMDTEINLGAHDITSGDVLVLTFVNMLSPETGLNREMELLLRVRRFGFVREINDSFIFLRRNDANYSRIPSVVQQAMSTIAEGEELERDVSAGVNFQLTPGAALTWTYFDRDRQSILNWLRPGAGVQVSFPKFETITYTISRPAGATQEQVSVTQESRSNSFDIAVGGIVTFFDNAIGLSYGRNLMAQQDPTYVGFSVSFVSLARRAAQLLPTQ